MGSDQFTEIGTSISKLSRQKRRGQKTMDHGSLYELYFTRKERQPDLETNDFSDASSYSS